MRPFLLFLALLLTGYALPQAQAEAGPVTKDEVKASLAKMEAIMEKRLGVKIPASTLKGSQPATRTEVIGEFTRVLDSVWGKLRFTPRPQKVYEDPIAKANQGPVLAQVRRLIRLGLAGPVGPLATGGETLTLEEYGDALGLFVVNIAAYTHIQDPAWTPNLQKP